MVPVFFGAAGRKLLGEYHAPNPPDGEAGRGCAVVLCNPLGWEAFASQRSYRVLADRLAAKGFPVLRFDYAGTGDSEGSDFERGRVRAWLDSVGSAIAEIQRLSGLSAVGLVGAHLGATFAAAVSSEAAEGSVASLVLWAPFLSGKSYLRQVRAYRMLNAPGAAERPSGREEAAGFVLTQETIDDLSALDLSSWMPPPGCRVLVLNRDEQSPEERLAARLARAGASVERAHLHGYAQMMQEPRKSVVPEAVFGKIVAWLGEAHPGRAPAPAPADSPRPAVLMTAEAREEALFLGRGGRSFGILTSPTAPSSASAPVIVWLNTASDHRIGPNRLYVTLARRLAGLGFTSLRFDPPGIGDGEGPELEPASQPYSRERLAEVRDALDWLAAERAARRFAVVGLCSAAYVAFHLAREDRRVASEILINPQTFVWREGDSLDVVVRKSFASNRSYLQRLLDPDNWKRALRGEVDLPGIAGAIAGRLATRALRRVRRLLPERPGGPLDVERTLRRTLSRGADVLFVFGEDDPGLDYIEGHLGSRASALRQARGFRFEVVSGTDHTFSPHAAQERLSAILCDHLVGRFGPGERP